MQLSGEYTNMRCFSAYLLTLGHVWFLFLTTCTFFCFVFFDDFFSPSFWLALIKTETCFVSCIELIAKPERKKWVWKAEVRSLHAWVHATSRPFTSQVCFFLSVSFFFFTIMQCRLHSRVRLCPELPRVLEFISRSKWLHSRALCSDLMSKQTHTFHFIPFHFSAFNKV